MMQPPLWIGLDNYTRLFTEDELFRKALTNTAIYALFSVPLNLIVAFVFALLLNLKIPGRTVFRSGLLLPRDHPDRGDGHPLVDAAEHAGRAGQRRACKPWDCLPSPG